MPILRAMVAIGGVVLAALIVWASYAASFGASFEAITADPWGLVTLADLYLGFVLIAIVIAGFERGWTAVLWLVPLPFLGNVWAVIWIVARLPVLWRRLAPTGNAAS